MKNNNKILKLSELSVGQTGIVIEIQENDKEIKRHLLDMGITKGTIIYVKKVAPLGNPINIELRDYDLIICKEILSGILVEVMD